MSFRARRYRVLLARLLLVAGALALWQFAPIHNPLSYAKFSVAVSHAYTLLRSGGLVYDLGTTAEEIVISLLIATGGGFLIGFALWRLPTVNRLVAPYLTSYYAVPVIVFYPILIAFFGLTNTPVIVLAAAWAIVAVIVSTVAGLNGLPPVYHKVVSIYRLRPWQAAWHVYLPGAAPLVFSGLRLAAGYAIAGVLAAQFLLSGNGGLGYRVSYAYLNFQTADTYSAILVVILFATVGTTVVNFAERRISGRR